MANLLDNALRHTPRGGQVDIAAGTDGDAVTITVTDDGDGIPAEHLPHVFERFYRADAARTREHGGAGIGLAIAKALVEAHQGHITASQPRPGDRRDVHHHAAGPRSRLAAYSEARMPFMVSISFCWDVTIDRASSRAAGY